MATTTLLGRSLRGPEIEAKLAALREMTLVGVGEGWRGGGAEGRGWLCPRGKLLEKESNRTEIGERGARAVIDGRRYGKVRSLPPRPPPTLGALT